VETASRGLIHAPQDLSQTRQWQVAPAVVAEPASGDLLPTPPDLRTTPLRRPTEAGPTAPSPLAPAEAGPTAPVAAPLPSCRDEVYMRWRAHSRWRSGDVRVLSGKGEAVGAGHISLGKHRVRSSTG
jgi:hypothetical protein